jgi:hypothetical protein
MADTRTPKSAADEVLLHALGLDDRHVLPWRNSYVSGAEPGPDVLAAVAAGHMVEARAPGYLAAGDRAWLVTAAGKVHALRIHAKQHRARQAETPAHKRRSKDRYTAWLSADIGVSFGDWLRWRMYEGMR